MDSHLGCGVICDVRTIKEHQLEIRDIFQPPQLLSKIVRDECIA